MYTGKTVTPKKGTYLNGEILPPQRGHIGGGQLYGESQQLETHVPVGK